MTRQLSKLNLVLIKCREKQNASERINLQHIMELREQFESADKDGGNSLDEDEVRDYSCLTLYVVYRALW